MDRDDRFATRLESVEEVPELFHRALREQLAPQEVIHLLVFNPAYTRPDARSPATLLAVTDRRWLAVSEDEELEDAEGRITATGCGFEDALLVELTEILLFGQLKIDFLAQGTAQAWAIEFNTVMDELFREAAQFILRGIEGGPMVTAFSMPKADSLPDTWPLKLRNAVPNVLPADRQLLAAVQWQAVYGGFRRELAPAAALLATKGELVLLSEERAWSRRSGEPKYGCVATYFPLVRLANFSFRQHGRFSVLELEMHASHGGETLQVLFPPEQERAIAQVVECALRQSSKHSRGSI